MASITQERIAAVAADAGLSPSAVTEALVAAIASAATKAWGPGRSFEASFNSEVGAVDVHQVLRVVETVSDPLAEVPLERVRDLGFGPGDEMLAQVFYHDEDAPSARAAIDSTPEIPPLAVLAEPLPLPDGAPPWLESLWPRRRLPWRWGKHVTLPGLEASLDTLVRWLRTHAPAHAVSIAPAPADELARLSALGTGASDLVALYTRLGGACDAFDVFAATLTLPSRGEALTHTMAQLARDDPSFGPWSSRYWPFLSWIEEVYAVDLDDADGPRVLHWTREGRTLTVEAPSLAAWLGLVAVAADTELLSWQQGVWRDLAAFRELQGHLFEGFPREVER